MCIYIHNLPKRLINYPETFNCFSERRVLAVLFPRGCHMQSDVFQSRLSLFEVSAGLRVMQQQLNVPCLTCSLVCKPCQRIFAPFGFDRISVAVRMSFTPLTDHTVSQCQRLNYLSALRPAPIYNSFISFTRVKPFFI